jgi:hypothetical protein
MDSKRLIDQITGKIAQGKAAMPAAIEQIYDLAYDESASAAARQYAVRNLLKNGHARPESPQPNPDFQPQPMSDETRAYLLGLLERLK